MNARERIVWWRLLVPFAVLVFCALLPNQWASTNADKDPAHAVAESQAPALSGSGDRGVAPTLHSRVPPIVMHPDGNLRLAAAPSAEMDVATRNMRLPGLQPREYIPLHARIGRVALPIAGIADEVTTHAGISRGCKEVGLVKNTAVRIIAKVVLVIANWALVEYGDGTQDWVQWIGVAVWGGVAYHNSKLDCGKR